MMAQAKDGRKFPIELHATGAGRGKDGFLVVTMCDISVRKAAEEALRRSRDLLEDRVRERTRALTDEVAEHRSTGRKLRRAKGESDLANRSKSEFLANMSHELRTPLNAVIGFSDMIACETFGPLGHAKYRGYVNDIRESGSHLLELITDILDVSAIESGKMELHPEDVDVARVVAESSTIRMVFTGILHTICSFPGKEYALRNKVPPASLGTGSQCPWKICFFPYLSTEAFAKLNRPRTGE